MNGYRAAGERMRWDNTYAGVESDCAEVLFNCDPATIPYVDIASRS